MSVSIELHPLAVLNISDHLTRAKYQLGQTTDYRVIGVLLGKQSGRFLDIVNTIEGRFADGPRKEELRDRIDERFIEQRINDYKKMFPDLECIGWYSAGKVNSDLPLPGDIALNKQFQKFTENPLFVMLNPESDEAKRRKALPMFIYEMDSTPGSAATFSRVDYQLATSDSERIAVDHIAKAVDSSTQTTTSQLSQAMTSSLNALKILRRKIRFLVDIVRNSPEVRANHSFMRRLQQICAQLPIAERAEFEAHAFPEYADVSVVNLLSTVVKASEMLNGLVEDFKVYNSGSNRFGLDPMDPQGIYEDDVGMQHQFVQKSQKKGGFLNFGGGRR